MRRRQRALVFCSHRMRRPDSTYVCATPQNSNQIASRKYEQTTTKNANTFHRRFEIVFNIASRVTAKICSKNRPINSPLQLIKRCDRFLYIYTLVGIPNPNQNWKITFQRVYLWSGVSRLDFEPLCALAFNFSVGRKITHRWKSHPRVGVLSIFH